MNPSDNSRSKSPQQPFSPLSAHAAPFIPARFTAAAAAAASGASATGATAIPSPSAATASSSVTSPFSGGPISIKPLAEHELKRLELIDQIITWPPNPKFTNTQKKLGYDIPEIRISPKQFSKKILKKLQSLQLTPPPATFTSSASSYAEQQPKTQPLALIHGRFVGRVGHGEHCDYKDKDIRFLLRNDTAEHPIDLRKTMDHILRKLIIEHLEDPSQKIFERPDQLATFWSVFNTTGKLIRFIDNYFLYNCACPEPYLYTLDIGKVDFTFIKEGNCRSGVAYSDLLCIAFLEKDPYYIVKSPSPDKILTVDECLQMYLEYIYEIFNGNEIFKLNWRAICKLSQGLKIPGLRDEIILLLITKLKSDYPPDELKERLGVLDGMLSQVNFQASHDAYQYLFSDHSDALTRFRHHFFHELKKHFEENPQGQIVYLINLLSVLSFIKPDEEAIKPDEQTHQSDIQEIYLKALAYALEAKGSLKGVKNLIDFLKNHPKDLPFLLDLIQGAMLQEWMLHFEGGKIEAYAFPFSERDQPRDQIRFGKDYVSLCRFRSPVDLAVRCLKAWDHLEKQLGSTAEGADFINNILAEVGLRSVTFSEKGKAHITQQFLHGFEKQPLTSVLANQFRGNCLLDPLYRKLSESQPLAQRKLLQSELRKHLRVAEEKSRWMTCLNECIYLLNDFSQEKVQREAARALMDNDFLSRIHSLNTLLNQFGTELSRRIADDPKLHHLLHQVFDQLIQQALAQSKVAAILEAKKIIQFALNADIFLESLKNSYSSKILKAFKGLATHEKGLAELTSYLSEMTQRMSQGKISQEEEKNVYYSLHAILTSESLKDRIALARPFYDLIFSRTLLGHTHHPYFFYQFIAQHFLGEKEGLEIKQKFLCFFLRKAAGLLESPLPNKEMVQECLKTFLEIYSSSQLKIDSPKEARKIEEFARELQKKDLEKFGLPEKEKFMEMLTLFHPPLAEELSEKKNLLFTPNAQTCLISVYLSAKNYDKAKEWLLKFSSQENTPLKVLEICRHFLLKVLEQQPSEDKKELNFVLDRKRLVSFSETLLPFYTTLLEHKLENIKRFKPEQKKQFSEKLCQLLIQLDLVPEVNALMRSLFQVLEQNRFIQATEVPRVLAAWTDPKGKPSLTLDPDLVENYLKITTQSKDFLQSDEKQEKVSKLIGTCLTTRNENRLKLYQIGLQNLWDLTQLIESQEKLPALLLTHCLPMIQNFPENWRNSCPVESIVASLIELMVNNKIHEKLPSDKERKEVLMILVKIKSPLLRKILVPLVVAMDDAQVWHQFLKTYTTSLDKESFEDVHEFFCSKDGADVKSLGNPDEQLECYACGFAYLMELKRHEKSSEELYKYANLAVILFNQSKDLLSQQKKNPHHFRGQLISLLTATQESGRLLTACEVLLQGQVSEEKPSSENDISSKGETPSNQEVFSLITMIGESISKCANEIDSATAQAFQNVMKGGFQLGMKRSKICALLKKLVPNHPQLVMAILNELCFKPTLYPHLVMFAWQQELTPVLQLLIPVLQKARSYHSLSVCFSWVQESFMEEYKKNFKQTFHTVCGPSLLEEIRNSLKQESDTIIDHPTPRKRQIFMPPQSSITAGDTTISIKEVYALALLTDFQKHLLQIQKEEPHELSQIEASDFYKQCLSFFIEMSHFESDPKVLLDYSKFILQIFPRAAFRLKKGELSDQYQGLIQLLSRNRDMGCFAHATILLIPGLEGVINQGKACKDICDGLSYLPLDFLELPYCKELVSNLLATLVRQGKLEKELPGILTKLLPHYYEIIITILNDFIFIGEAENVSSSLKKTLIVKEQYQKELLPLMAKLLPILSDANAFDALWKCHGWIGHYFTPPVRDVLSSQLFNILRGIFKKAIESIGLTPEKKQTGKNHKEGIEALGKLLPVYFKCGALPSGKLSDKFQQELLMILHSFIRVLFIFHHYDLIYRLYNLIEIYFTEGSRETLLQEIKKNLNICFDSATKLEISTQEGLERAIRAFEQLLPLYSKHAPYKGRELIEKLLPKMLNSQLLQAEILLKKAEELELFSPSTLKNLRERKDRKESQNKETGNQATDNSKAADKNAADNQVISDADLSRLNQQMEIASCHNAIVLAGKIVVLELPLIEAFCQHEEMELFNKGINRLFQVLDSLDLPNREGQIQEPLLTAILKTFKVLDQIHRRILAYTFNHSDDEERKDTYTHFMEGLIWRLADAKFDVFTQPVSLQLDEIDALCTEGIAAISNIIFSAVSFPVTAKRYAESRGDSSLSQFTTAFAEDPYHREIFLEQLVLFVSELDERGNRAIRQNNGFLKHIVGLSVTFYETLVQSDFFAKVASRQEALRLTTGEASGASGASGAAAGVAGSTAAESASGGAAGAVARVENSINWKQVIFSLLWDYATTRLSPEEQEDFLPRLTAATYADLG